MGKQQLIKNNQAGFVSILFTIVMMTIISLIVVSFSANARREQRQALDRQLSEQAFRAAETAVNYVRKEIELQLEKNADVEGLNQDACQAAGPSSKAYRNLNSVLSDAESAEISCVLVRTAPRNLVYDLDPTSQSKVFPLMTTDPLAKLKLSWTVAPNDTDSIAECPSSDSAAGPLPASGEWKCPYAMLRTDLTRFEPQIDRSRLAGNTFAGVVTPTSKSSPGEISFTGENRFANGSGAAQGSRYPAKCDATTCEVVITNLSGTTHYMRLGALYRSTKVTLTGYDASGNELPFKGTQVVIDATGKSQDILRRIEIRTPLTGSGGNLYADYGLQSTGGICKAFTAYYNENDLDYSNSFRNSGC